MWITRKMWNTFQTKWDERWEEITRSITVLNGDYGAIKRDVGWLKWFTGVIVAVIIGTAFTLIWKSLGA